MQVLHEVHNPTIEIFYGLTQRKGKKKANIICVNYEYQNDHHIFVSNKLSGLFVCSKDYHKAIKTIKPCIEALLYHETGKEWKARIICQIHH